MNKHIITTYACLLICIYFGYQAPRAATGGGTALLYAISCGFLIVCMICAVKYEAAQLFKNKVPRSTKFNRFNSNDPAPRNHRKRKNRRKTSRDCPQLS